MTLVNYINEHFLVTMTLPNQLENQIRNPQIIMDTKYILNIVIIFMIKELIFNKNILTVYPTGVSRGVFCFC